MKAYLYRLFNERINRRTYLVGLILNSFVLLSTGLILKQYNERIPYIFQHNIFAILLFIVFISLEAIIFLSLCTRRQHDWGAKGLSLNFFNNDFVYKAGQKEKNEFGKPPEPKIDIKGLFGFSL